VVAFNEFTGQLVALKRTLFDDPGLTYPRQWTDVDGLQTLAWLQGTKGIVMEAGITAVEHALDVVGETNSFHPPRDYFRALNWDAVQRLPTWLSTYLGAEQTDYTAQAGTAWLISAIARVMQPGCQADYMLVLEGSQGARKSTALRVLFSDDWFSDSLLPIGTDEAYKKIQGKLCQEIAELESFRGKSATLIKAFITARIDNFRDSYGRRPKDRARTVIFAGTTNEREYLIDRTGNRRFWPVKCGTIDTAALARDRDMLWAEAVARYDSGEKWWLPDERLAREEQRSRELREPWFELVAKWLERPTIPDGQGGARTLLDEADGFTMADVLQGALAIRASDMDHSAQTRIGFILAKLGFASRQVRVGATRERRYFRLMGQ
jgi:predicted P-loop ATPase